MRCWLWILPGLIAGAASAADTEWVNFGVETLPPFVVLHNASQERVRHEGGFARQVRFEKVDWPNVFFQAPQEGWDWSAHAGVSVSIFNPSDRPVPIAMRVDNAGADGANHCNNASGSVAPHSRCVLSLRFRTKDAETLWGMRGVPIRGPLGTGPILDMTKITGFQVFLPRPQETYTLIFERAWFFGVGGNIDELVAMPFVDRFGQYKNDQWPGKITVEEEFPARRDAEAQAIQAQPELPGRDTYGGWADGPDQEATGWFRTENLQGKWWLVTPSGHLFFSNGVDCVGTGDVTFVEGRPTWFEWLPGPDEKPYGDFYAEVSGAHSNADVIGGKGRAFSFHRANLFRKYGEFWPERWRERTFARLKAWGFNTIGNWAQGDVLEHSPLPYTVSSGVWNVPPISGAKGYWAKMMDVYDPVFPSRVEASVGPTADAHGKNPLCIGYFVDNELAWEGVAVGTLESPVEQPCRKVLIEQLQAQYGTLDALNAAWGTAAATWDVLRPTNPLNEKMRQDLDAFLYRFAERYFATVREVLRQHAPNQLYLGCRFAGAPDPAVRACAAVADVVSYNLYQEKIAPDRWVGNENLGKPILIGEFHFGALDRGMFHTGLVATANQAERAQAYARYVRSVADHPAFIGCHWFQFVDEPITGRWFDGENYNIGMIDVTDTPYAELTQAAQSVHKEIYARRYGAP